MSIWNNGTASPAGDKLLLLGIYDTGSYNKGYREIELDPANSNRPYDSAVVNSPGSISPSTVDDRRKYDATLARYSVYYIHQAPDRVVFASTAINGLQSLRLSNGKPIWNAEE
jgi:hypothetical protein